MPKESGPIKNIDEFDREEERDNQKFEDIRREKHEERVAEILSRPQQIMVRNSDIAILKSAGEVALSGVDLYGRKLKEGEKVILLDEDMREIEVEFVGVDDAIFGKKIKVRLPEPKPQLN